MKARARELVPPPEPGRYSDWVMERYLEADALNASTCQDICPPAGDPAEALRKRFWKHTETVSTRLGTAIHAAILEPVRFDVKYMVMPTRGTGLVKYREEMRELGHHLLSQTEMDIARCAREQVYSHPLASKLLTGITPEHVEQTFFFKLPVTVDDEVIAIDGKMRADLCREDIGCWIDIKSTRKIDPYGWCGESAKYGYDLTKAWYQKGIDRCQQMGCVDKITDYFFLCIENHFPCRVEVYEMGGATTALGKERLNASINAWAECVAANDWPSGRSGDVRPYEHPEYAFTEWGEWLSRSEEEQP